MKIVTIITLLLLSGCSEVMIGGSAIVSKAALEERSFSDSLTDVKIWTSIKNDFFKLKDGEKIFNSITVKIVEGRVLLTGNLITQSDMIKAIRVVWSQKGVKEVINEIKVKEREQKNLATLAQDSWITTQIRSKIIFDKKIKSVNYSIETIDQVVYLIGIAQNDEEHELVANIAAKTKHVKKVISHIRIKNSSLRKK